MTGLSMPESSIAVVGLVKAPLNIGMIRNSVVPSAVFQPAVWVVHHKTFATVS
jgi:hypothetical protein